jgi:predicted kinase
LQLAIRDTITLMSPFNEQVDLDVLAEDNIRVLELPKGRLSPPMAIILVGLPASGKSFLVQNLAKALPLAVLSEEEMLKFLAPRISFFKRAQGETIVLALKTIEKLIQRGISCIFDSSVKKRTDRHVIKQSVEASGGRLVLIHVDVTKEEAYEQISKSNYEVTRGEKKGVILNKDLFEYEVASTMLPLAEERALVYKPKEFESLNNVIQQISER